MNAEFTEKSFDEYVNYVIKSATNKVGRKLELTEADIKKAVQDFKKNNNNGDASLYSVSKYKEQWIWVTGYKGTEKNMMCRDYQYEMGKLHVMPDDEEIIDCRSGFHLCLNMKDVTRYYEIGNGRRYFEVQALVRARDFDNYGKIESAVNSYTTQQMLYTYLLNDDHKRNKLAAKSIIFTRELTVDEILKNTEAETWSTEFKQMAIVDGIVDARNAMHAQELAKLGYSEAFAKYICRENGYEVAKEVSSQKDLSMDMKVLCILRGL